MKIKSTYIALVWATVWGMCGSLATMIFWIFWWNHFSVLPEMREIEFFGFHRHLAFSIDAGADPILVFPLVFLSSIIYGKLHLYGIENTNKKVKKSRGFFARVWAITTRWTRRAIGFFTGRVWGVIAACNNGVGAIIANLALFHAAFVWIFVAVVFVSLLNCLLVQNAIRKGGPIAQSRFAKVRSFFKSGV